MGSEVTKTSIPFQSQLSQGLPAGEVKKSSNCLVRLISTVCDYIKRAWRSLFSCFRSSAPTPDKAANRVSYDKHAESSVPLKEEPVQEALAEESEEEDLSEGEGLFAQPSSSSEKVETSDAFEELPEEVTGSSEGGMPAEEPLESGVRREFDKFIGEFSLSQTRDWQEAYRQFLGEQLSKMSVDSLRKFDPKGEALEKLITQLSRSTPQNRDLLVGCCTETVRLLLGAEVPLKSSCVEECLTQAFNGSLRGEERTYLIELLAEKQKIENTQSNQNLLEQVITSSIDAPSPFRLKYASLLLRSGVEMSTPYFEKAFSDLFNAFYWNRPLNSDLAILFVDQRAEQVARSAVAGKFVYDLLESSTLFPEDEKADNRERCLLEKLLDAGVFSDKESVKSKFFELCSRIRWGLTVSKLDRYRVIELLLDKRSNSLKEADQEKSVVGEIASICERSLIDEEKPKFRRLFLRLLNEGFALPENIYRRVQDWYDRFDQEIGISFQSWINSNEPVLGRDVCHALQDKGYRIKWRNVRS